MTDRPDLDQFEREQTIRRTKHGLDERKRQGMYLGAPRIITDAKLKQIRRDLKAKDATVKTVAKKHGIAASSVYGYIKGGKSAVAK